MTSSPGSRKAVMAACMPAVSTVYSTRVSGKGPTAVGAGGNDDLVQTQLPVLLDEVFEKGRVVLRERLEQTRSASGV